MFCKRTLLSAAALILPLEVAAAQDIAVDVSAGAKVDPAAAAAPVAEVVDEAVDEAVDSAQEVTADANASVAAETPAAGAIVAVTLADLKVGAMVHDTKGGMVGTIESADAAGAVVATGKSRVKIPVESFGKNAQSLVIAMTKDQLDAEASAEAKAKAS